MADDIHDSPTPPTATPRASVPKPRATKPTPKPAARKIVTHTKAGAVELGDAPAPSSKPLPARQAKTADRNVRAVKPKS